MAKDKDIVKVNAAEVVLMDNFTENDIRHRIYTIRGVQVMLDRDLAMYFQTETRSLNQAVKRNINRFPERFMFQLTQTEWETIKSQIVMTSISSQNVMTSVEKRPNAALPFAFTEQGVSQLSSVLKSPRAIEMSIRIIDAFVAMRRFLIQNAGVFQRLDNIEQHQLLTDNKVNEAHSRIDSLLDKLDDGSLKHKLGMFFNGQMFESYSLVEELIQRAKKRVMLIDDYVDASVLEHLRMRKKGVPVDVYVNKRHQTAAMKEVFDVYHKQYPTEHVELHTFEKSHDRWMIIDDEVYHFGASIKDLGQKWFAVNRVTEYSAEELIRRL